MNVVSAERPLIRFAMSAARSASSPWIKPVESRPPDDRSESAHANQRKAATRIVLRRRYAKRPRASNMAGPAGYSGPAFERDSVPQKSHVISMAFGPSQKKRQVVSIPCPAVRRRGRAGHIARPTRRNDDAVHG